MALAHMLLEADKSQDLQGEWASWKPKRTNGVLVRGWQAKDSGRADISV